MRKYFRAGLFTLAIFFPLLSSFAQSDYLMSLSNGSLINDNTYEFDILIKSTDENFELTSYQCALTFNTEIINGGNLDFSFMEGTSELSNIPFGGIGINSSDNNQEITFGSMAGNDNITGIFKRVGRFRLINSLPFENNELNFAWNFEGTITTILTGATFINITEPDNHINDIVAGIENELLNDYQLEQNYPNPFNPSTKIRFGLKEVGKVKLVIFNLLGEMVDEIINNEMPAGVHEIEFSGNNLASGIYIYKLDVQDKFTSIKKMTLLK